MAINRIEKWNLENERVKYIYELGDLMSLASYMILAMTESDNRPTDRPTTDN